VVKQYRSLENQGTETRKDDILRAAVCAFVALTQPTKRDCNQIEDLALSILPYTSISTKRFIAAALANSHQAPNALVRRLCDEAPEVCAPLLLKSPALSALDLTVFVGTKSREHARIISKREHLPNSVIEALALLDDPIAQARITYGNVSKVGDLKDNKLSNLMPITADEARERLREIMAVTMDDHQGETAHISPSNHTIFATASGIQQRLEKLALHDQEGVFITALADLSGLPFAKILKFTRRKTHSELSTLLKSFEIEASSAFVMCAVFYPSIAANREEIRLFIDRHNSLDIELARDMVRDWKASEIMLTVSRTAANTPSSQEEAFATINDDIDWEALVRAS
jgi:uncharacterized protein (DUF2336 family)